MFGDKRRSQQANRRDLDFFSQRVKPTYTQLFFLADSRRSRKGLLYPDPDDSAAVLKDTRLRTPTSIADVQRARRTDADWRDAIGPVEPTQPEDGWPWLAVAALVGVFILIVLY